MAGHSKFKNIMHRKGAQDNKRAKMFTKLVREIYVAAKSGLPEPDSNPRLRAAINAARIANMPKDRIENAISKATNPGEADNFEEIRYEGYGSGGVAIIVEALTDNRNRTASDVRSAFTKHGGTLGETGSVSFMFSRVGVITYPANKGSAEVFLDTAIEAGANDSISDEEIHEIICDPENFNEIRDKFEHKFGTCLSAEITWKPNNTIMLNEESAEKIIKMVDALEDNDDVQSVVGNFEFPETILNKFKNED
ncbi:YebC/PmpR family DNA-binding transcriptional regulator [Holosporaceae bacterium 'Namur']|nr:YebC/PmpR family DNA-binding transcriptional regulator [Holosporaceae bacterium 'Namur']